MACVLFLGGFGRSGTTLLGRLLGELPGVCFVGEIVNLWRRGLLENERCGCGEAFHDCPFWQRVGEVAFGGWHTVDGRHVLALKSSLDRIRLIPLLAAPRLQPTLRRRLEEYGALHLRLYAAIAEVSGCSVIADASKHASQAFCLRWCAGLDLRVLHVVRDSRGVAYSWTKKVRRPETPDPDNVMDRFSLVHAAVLWDVYNVAFELLAHLRVATRLVRYEDLVRAPARILWGIADFVGICADKDSLSFLGEGYVELTATHTVAGNPIRFETGRIDLYEDDAWRSRLPAWRRRAVSALTLPLLVQYGYKAWRRGRRWSLAKRG